MRQQVVEFYEVMEPAQELVIRVELEPVAESSVLSI